LSFTAIMLQDSARMIEQPPVPDAPHPPDLINHLPPPKVPVPPGDPAGEDKPDVHPVPPPTDPSPPVL
jgi:hypothetical protein